MRLTLTDLGRLTQDPEYRKLPKQIALGKCEDGTWGQTMDVMTEEGLNATVWYARHLVACLFDTYGEAIEQVSHHLSVEDSDTAIAIKTNINDNVRWSHAQDLGLPQQLMAHINLVDGAHTLKSVLSQLEGLGDMRLMSQLEEFRYAMEGDITSGQKAREDAQDIAPELHAWAKAHMLSWRAQTKDQPASKPSI